MKRSVHSSFWNGGADAYIKALKDEEEQAIQPIRDALRIETDPEIKRSLRDQIKGIRTEYKKKRKSADSSLFIGQ